MIKPLTMFRGYLDTTRSGKETFGSSPIAVVPLWWARGNFYEAKMDAMATTIPNDTPTQGQK
jgi:hypothetical protein